MKSAYQKHLEIFQISPRKRAKKFKLGLRIIGIFVILATVMLATADLSEDGMKGLFGPYIGAVVLLLTPLAIWRCYCFSTLCQERESLENINDFRTTFVAFCTLIFAFFAHRAFTQEGYQLVLNPANQPAVGRSLILFVAPVAAVLAATMRWWPTEPKARKHADA